MTEEVKKVDIKALMEQNRPELNAFGGASFGSKYFKTEARAAILNFDELKHNVESNGNVDFMLNRTPLRIKVKDYDIQAIALKNDAQGAAQLVINGDLDGEVRIPFGYHNDKPAFSKVTDDALGKALRGDNSIIFSDAQKLVDQVNALNIAEKQRLLQHIEDVKRFIQGIDCAINENKKKANEYYKQLLRTNETKDGDAVIIAPTSGTLPKGETVVVNV